MRQHTEILRTKVGNFSSQIIVFAQMCEIFKIHRFLISTESGPRVESSKTKSWPQKPSWDLPTFQSYGQKDTGRPKNDFFKNTIQGNIILNQLHHPHI